MKIYPVIPCLTRNLYKLFFIFILACVLPNTTFASETSYTYTNHEQDTSGLMYYDSRYYDPDLGRFLQPDAFDVPNKYSYVNNDPVNYIDPSGHWGEFTGNDLFGGNLIPDWQMDYAQNSSSYISYANQNSIYNSNLFFLDGMTLNGNIPFDIDSLPTDMSMYADYKSYTPYVNAVKEVLVEFLGLDSEAGVLGMVRGPVGMPTKGPVDGYYRAGKLASMKVNETILKLRSEIFGPFAKDVSELNIGRSAKELTHSNLTKFIFEVPLEEIYPIHDIYTQSLRGKGEPLVKSIVSNLIRNQYDLRYPMVLYPRNGAFSVIEGHHRLSAMGVLDQKTIPAIIQTEIGWNSFMLNKK